MPAATGLDLQEAKARELLERALDRTERTLGALRQRAHRRPGETALGVDEVRQRGGELRNGGGLGHR